MNDDKLSAMFDDQRSIMDTLIKLRNFPNYPLDLSVKENQRVIKEVAFEAMTELFESIKELKNGKRHRATEIKEFDRVKFLEELIDAQHYIIEIALLAGYTSDEYFESFMNKGQVVRERAEMGY